MDSESEDNWTWFFENLYQVLAPQGRTVTFISDRNPGLLEGVNRIFPSSPHAYCYFHLVGNLKNKLPVKVVGKYLRERVLNLFMKCAYAPTVEIFYKHLADLEKEGHDNAKKFLESIPFEHWACAFFKGNRYGVMANGLSESFNFWILKFRSLPIFEMVDGIRVQIMETMDKRRTEASSWHNVLCPKMDEMLRKYMEVGRHWKIARSYDSVYEVFGPHSVLVDLNSNFCTCRRWKIEGFPCAHALVAIQREGKNVYDYIEDEFKSGYYRNSYAAAILPIPDIEISAYDASDFVIPPFTKRPPGRPRSTRYKSIGASSRSIKCGRCGKVDGHNKKTCTAPLRN